VTPDELREAARAYVERSTREQGVPFHVTDPSTLAHLAALFTPAPLVPRPRRTRAPGRKAA
jgi:hypothetical protein